MCGNELISVIHPAVSGSQSGNATSIFRICTVWYFRKYWDTESLFILNTEPPFQGVKISKFWDTLGDTLGDSWPILLDTLD
jgi:hypothetical protein